MNEKSLEVRILPPVRQRTYPNMIVATQTSHTMLEYFSTVLNLSHHSSVQLRFLDTMPGPEWRKMEKNARRQAALNQLSSEREKGPEDSSSRACIQAKTSSLAT